MDKLNTSSTNEAANDKVLLLIQEGYFNDDAFKSVSKETGRSIAAVKSYFHRHGGQPFGIHGNSKLTCEQEKMLVSMVIVFGMMHEALSIKDLKEFTEEIFSIKISKSWAGAFIKRHKDDIGLRKTKLLAKKRVDNSIIEHVALFVASIEALNATFPYVEDNVFNYDETRVFVADEGGVQIKKVGKERAQHRGVKGKTIGSLLSFIGATGHVLLSVWIFAAKKEKGNDNNQQNTLVNVDFTLPDVPSYPKRGQWPRYYAWTDTGYSNKELHESIMECFCNEWLKISKSRYCYVFGDQLGAHKSETVTEKCLKSNVLTCLLPANTSHFLQPLDDVIFARFKQVINLEFQTYQLSQKTTSEDIKRIMHKAAYHAKTLAFTVRVIKRAFSNTGMFPWKPELILEKAKQNAGEEMQATKHQYVSMMKKAADLKMHPKESSTKLSQGSVRVEASTAFNPFEIIEKAQTKEKAKKKIDDDKKKRKAEAEKVAQQKKQAKVAAVAKRAARKCTEHTCNTISRFDDGAKNWGKCINCDKLFCPKHIEQYKEHVKTCYQDSSSDTEPLTLVEI